MNTRVSRVLAAAALLAVTCGAASTQPVAAATGHSNTAANAMDKTFTTMAAMGGTAEIALSKVAMMRSSDPKIKAFAATMVHDHSAMGQALKVTAMSAHLPAPMVLDPMHRALRAKLMRLSGKSFDNAYMTAMINDHAKTVSLFQNEIAHGMNIHVTNLATKNVGAVQNHLQMAHDLTGTQNKPSKIKNPKTNTTAM